MTSAHTLANLDPVTLRSFRAWRRAFRKAFKKQKRDQPDLEESFSDFINAGCDQDDLEWALFWVALNLDLSKERPEEIAEIKRSFVLADKILPKIVDLRMQLDLLLTWPAQKRSPKGFYLFLSVLHQVVPHLNIPQRRDRILRTLLDLELLLKAILALKVNTAQLAATAASATEVVLIEYVRRATRSRRPIDETADQLSSPVKVALKAYGIQVWRQYEGEMWARRYRRFKKADKKKFQVIVDIIEDFLARKSRGESLSLIPFFNDSYVSLVRSEYYPRPDG